MKAVPALAILLTFTTHAVRAEDFDFSFATDANNTYYSGGGFTPGTVSGALIGLSANGTSSPTDVLLFSNPDRIPDGDLFAQGWFNPNGSPGTFTVTDGAITAESYTLYSTTTNQELTLGLPFNGVAFNLLINYIFDDTTGNDAGLDGISFTPVDVPEPAGILPFLAGAVFLLGLRWFFLQTAPAARA
jgi:hypothetical protein